MKTILKMTACLIVSIITGFVLIVLVYLIPTDQIEANAATSAIIFEEEGDYPYYYNLPGYLGVRDNYTDALMILIAAYTDKNDPVNAAMLNYWQAHNYLPLTRSMAEHYIRGVEWNATGTYERYWHGYLVFLKPVMLLVNYEGWKLLNIIFQLGLSAAVIYLMYNRGLKLYIFPYIMSMLVIEPFVMAANIQNTTCYTIIRVSIIVLILMKNKLSTWDIFIFMFIGVVTAFLDLLTYPLATLGVPAVICFCMLEKEPIKASIVRLVKISAAWLFGYAGMWAGKWLVAWIVTGRDTFGDAISRLIYRSGTKHHEDDPEGVFSAYDAISKNINSFFGNPLGIMFGIFFLALLVFFITKAVRSHCSVSSVLITGIPFLILALYPFAWYTVVVNHSVIHCHFFTRKILVITIMAVSLWLVKALSDNAISPPEDPSDSE